MQPKEKHHAARQNNIAGRTNSFKHFVVAVDVVIISCMSEDELYRQYETVNLYRRGGDSGAEPPGAHERMEQSILP